MNYCWNPQKQANLLIYRLLKLILINPFNSLKANKNLKKRERVLGTLLLICRDDIYFFWHFWKAEIKAHLLICNFDFSDLKIVTLMRFQIFLKNK